VTGARVKRPKRIGVVGRGGNYVRMVAELLAATEIAPGSIAEAVVSHDNGCAYFNGGPCDCEPDVRIAWRDRP